MDMLRMMKEYNKLIKRWKDAEQYSRDVTVEAYEKAKYSDKLIQLHDDVIRVGKQIVEAGYEISEEEFEHGFRQIDFLYKHKLI